MTALHTYGVAEKILDTSSKAENKFFRSNDGGFVRLIEQRLNSFSKTMKNGHRIAEQAQAKNERIQMS